MITDITIPKELIEKRKHLAALRTELADLFERKEHMIVQEHDYLIALYTSLIGQMQYDEFVLKVNVAKLKRKVEMVQACKNRGERVDIAAIDQSIQDEFLEHQKELEQQLNNIRQANEILKAPTLSEDEVVEIKNVYRVLVKKLHPDLNKNLSEQDEELFVRAQTAYKLADLPELRNILLVTNKEKSYDELQVDNIDEEIAKLEKSRDDLKKKIEQLQATFPFTYEEQLMDEKWVKSTQQDIQRSIDNLNQELRKWETILAVLVGGYLSIGIA